jgi:hypothetical protein
MNMRTGAIIAGAALAIGALWLLLGRRIVLLIDMVFPGSPTPTEIGDLQITGDGFVIGPHSWPFLRGDAFDLKVAMSRSNRLVLATAPRAFTFGQVKIRWADKPEPSYLFVPDPGDSVSFTRDVSRLEWHTPFAFSIIGRKAKRHRYAYDRLRWKKNSGSALEIVWRSEQQFDGGWRDQYNYVLTYVAIHNSPVEKAAAAYLATVKGWTGAEYRLETQEPASDDVIVDAIYFQDESGSQPGGGKSVMLLINKSTGKVVSESAWQ